MRHHEKRLQLIALAPEDIASIMSIRVVCPREYASTSVSELQITQQRLNPSCHLASISLGLAEEML